MAVIPEDEVQFEIVSQNLVLVTKPEQDHVRMEGVQLTQTQAATMAWITNLALDTVLEVSIKIKV